MVIVHVLKADYDIVSLTVYAGVLKLDYNITNSPKLAIACRALKRICYTTQSPPKHLSLYTYHCVIRIIRSCIHT